ncbi:MAG: HYR domain-containing protein, partial [Paludibacteraceae bacterium]|nr:HYR domain-containing protein [Paludibacteraceae bacterium]
STSVNLTDGKAPVCTEIAPIAKALTTACDTTIELTFTGTDNCGIKNITYSVSGATSIAETSTDADAVTKSLTFNNGSNIVTWILTDSSKNSTTCSTSVNLTDGKAPVCTEIAPIAKALTTACDTTIELTFTGTDNCGITNIKYSVSGATTIAETSADADAVTKSLTFNNGQNIVTWILTDSSKNSTTCSTSVNLTDGKAPVCTEIAPIAKALTTACDTTIELTFTGTDNCGIKNITYSVSGATTIAEESVDASSTTQNLTFNHGVNIITWILSDSFSNVTTCSSTFVLSDGAAPVLTCAEAKKVLDATSDCNAAYEIPTIGVVDCSSTSTVVTRSDNAELTAAFPLGTTTITWTVTDTAQLTSTCEQTVIVKDVTAPVVASVADTVKLVAPADGCDVAYVIPSLNVTDCSDVTIKVERSDDKEVDANFAGVTTINWNVTDTAGLSTIVKQVVVVTDVTAPECVTIDTLKLVLAADQKEFTSEMVVDSLEKIQNSKSVYTIDACEGNIFGTYVSESVITPYTVDNAGDGELSVNWTFTDSTGNSRTCPQPVIVIDVTQPECPAIALDSFLILTDEMSGTDLADSLKALPLPTTNDASAGLLTGRLAEESFASTYVPGEYVVNWIFNDGRTGDVVCPQQIVIESIGKPEIDCDTILPVLDTMVGYNCGVALADVQLKIKQPVATEYNGKIMVEGVAGMGDFAENPLPAEFGVGLTTITWKFEDKYGHAVYCPQNIVVTDTTPGDTSGVCLRSPIYVAANADCQGVLDLPRLVIKNDCDGELVGVARRSDGKAVDAVYPKGQTKVYWTFTDNSGNKSECSQWIFVKDSTAPVIDCNSLVTIETYLKKGDCTVPFSQLRWRTPVAKDNCDVLVDATTSDAPDKFPVGSTTFTWTFTDVAGNSSTCPQVVAVYDTISPDLKDVCPREPLVVNAPADLCGSVAELPELKVQGDCDGDIVGVPVRADGLSLDAVYPLGETMVTWTFSDAHGNSSSCQGSVVVKDVTAPVFAECGNMVDLKLYTLKNEECVVSADSLGTHKATDACGEVIGVARLGDDAEEKMPDWIGIGNYRVAWLFADASGNSTICYQNLAVIDTFGADTTGVCPKEPIRLVANANCAAKAPTLPRLVIHDLCDDALLGEPVRSDGEKLSAPYQKGTTLITWTFTDNSGNQSFCYMDVIVSDTTAPNKSGVCPTTEFVAYADADCHANVQLPVLKALDNCDGIVTGIITRSDSLNLAEAYSKGVTEITWTFTDASGNSSFCRQNVVVRDSTPADTNNVCPRKPYEALAEAGCQANVDLPVLKAYDNCDGWLTGNLTRSDDKEVGEPFGKGITDLTWTFTDASGNNSFCYQQVIVTDRSAPAISCKSFVTRAYVKPYSCTVAIKDIEFTVPIAQDQCSGEIYGILVDSKDEYTVGSYKLRWKFTDEDGNTSYCPQTLVVDDRIAPEWDNNVASTVVELSCADNVPEFPEFTATDNCSEVSYVITDTTNHSDDPAKCEFYTYFAKRTYLAKDLYGNVSDTLTYTYQLSDKEAPTISFHDGWSDSLYLAHAIGHCMYAVPDLTYMLTDKHVSDNCADYSHLKIWQAPAEGDTILSSVYVTMYVEDVCGNVDSIKRYLYVPSRKSIVTAIGVADTICANDEQPIGLMSNEIRRGYGTSWIYEFGVWEEIPSTLMWDVYRDSISPTSVVFSNNWKTYAQRYADADGNISLAKRDSLTNLIRAYQSGRYYFVAMDTTTECTDTVGLDLVVRERPRISLDLGTVAICDGRSLNLEELYADFNVCVDDMNSDITDEGWMIDGTIYRNGDPVSYVGDSLRRLTYYATNMCGTSRSDSTFYLNCYGSPTSYADSLAEAGSVAAYKLMKRDSLNMNKSIGIDVHKEYKATDLLLTSTPQNKARVWRGDDATIHLQVNRNPLTVWWYRAERGFDGAGNSEYDLSGHLINGWDDDDFLMAVDHVGGENGPYNLNLRQLTDSASYYVVITDSVCPAIASNLVAIDVVDKIPTAFTPYTKDGLNDVFMPGFQVTIFNRYGQLVFQGNDGWDGTYRGIMADPAVYFYVVTLRDGSVAKGSIEVVKATKGQPSEGYLNRR